MQHHQLTYVEKVKRQAQKERRRRKKRQREDEYRRRVERLRRQIEEARRRRQRLLLLILLALVIMQETIRAGFRHSYIDWPEPIGRPTDWTPDPSNDYAPKDGHDDYCDGYSYEQWTRMLDERRIRLSRKAQLKAEWQAAPDYGLFPDRYRLWDHKPYVGQIMEELTARYWQHDALIALQLLSPPETHQYLAEAHATDPADLRLCRADRDADIIQAFQSRAVLWEQRKRREVQEAKRDKELSRKNDDDEGNPKPK